MKTWIVLISAGMLFAGITAGVKVGANALWQSGYSKALLDVSQQNDLQLEKIAKQHATQQANDQRLEQQSVTADLIKLSSERERAKELANYVKNKSSAANADCSFGDPVLLKHWNDPINDGEQYLTNTGVDVNLLRITTTNKVE